jgi:plastocyanin
MIQELVDSILAFLEPLIVPDWGALVALIPVALAGLVGLYLVWIAYRFATAGPTRRGKRRMPPVTPSGIHMPGPSFAPLLAAVGAFFLFFGMFAGGIWLWVGVAILVVTLLYWGREAMRDYDRVPAAGHAARGPVAGALPAPAGTPPAGVHIPPPSFRPLLVSIGFALLVTGMVIGGLPALLIGFTAVVVTSLGWLWDAVREYRATETADHTGHLDMGGAPAWPKATFAILAILVAVALVVTSGIIGGSSDGSATPSGAPPASEVPGGGAVPSAGASAAPSAGADADVVVVAQGIQWVETALTVPAGAAFTLALDNRDNGIPHDVVIKDAGGTEVFRTELVTGPAVVVYDVPAIPAGQYAFVCTVHPNMTGTITAQ